MKVFILYGDMYACSETVDLKFAELGGHVIARGCFSPGRWPEVYEKAVCLLKPENGRTLRFEGCVRNINSKNDISISVHSRLSAEGVPETIKRISALTA